MANETLDLRGLSCPIPVLRTNKVLKTLAPGDELTVVASDPAAPKDFENYCETTGHALLENRRDGEEFTFVIRRKG